MPTATFNQPTSTGSRADLTRDFDRLADLVRGSNPETVVLVARKMPRLRSVLNLSFGNAHVISDMAVPLSEPILRGHRVAIVDDFVNAGSTIDRAYRLVQEFEPREVQTFAVASRAKANKVGSSSILVRDERLDSHEYGAIVTALPRVFDTSAEAYDLEFPHIPCRYSLTIPHFDALVELLRQDFGFDAVQRVPGTTRSNKKITLVLPSGPGESIRKIRFYDVADDERLIAVPICVPKRFGIARFRQSINAILNQLMVVDELPPFGREVADTDVRSRLELFVRSLAVYNEFIARWNGLDEVNQWGTVFDLKQAALAFGPNIGRGPVLEALQEQLIAKTNEDAADAEEVVSPFSQSEIFEKLVEAASADRSAEPKIRLYAVFSELSQLVCSEDPDSYDLDWPYTAVEIQADPYLRLRVGPTFSDLVELLCQVDKSISSGESKLHVSRFLDVAIDSGAVVPTIGCMEGQCFRIYRKGEAGVDDRAIEILDISVQDCEDSRPRPAIPYSRTHVSKVVAALTFSGASPSYFSVKTEDRGTVAVTKSSVLSDGGDEVGKLLEIRKARSKDS